MRVEIVDPSTLTKVFKRLIPVMVSIQCPKCNRGTLNVVRGNPLTLVASNDEFHACTNCGHEVRIYKANGVYPRIEYLDENAMEVTR